MFEGPTVLENNVQDSEFEYLAATKQEAAMANYDSNDWPTMTALTGQLRQQQLPTKTATWWQCNEVQQHQPRLSFVIQYQRGQGALQGWHGLRWRRSPGWCCCKLFSEIKPTAQSANEGTELTCYFTHEDPDGICIHRFPLWVICQFIPALSRMKMIF